MKFMAMHKVDASMEANRPPSQKLITEMGALVGEAIAKGVFLDGNGLHRSALRAKVTFQKGKSHVKKGPYKGDNELLDSFAMIEAENLDDAVAIASRFGAALGDGEIEIGPVVEPWDLGMAEKPDGVPNRFLLLVKADKRTEAGEVSTLVDQLSKEGVALSGGKLAPSKQGARYTKGRWIDGPFAESKELIAGYSVLELPTWDDIKRWTERYAAIIGPETEVDVRVVA